VCNFQYSTLFSIAFKSNSDRLLTIIRGEQSMKHISSKQTIHHKNSDACSAQEYTLNDPEINCATIEVNGRYPETGYVSNQECKELAFIQNGNGTLTLKGETVALNPGDCLLLEPGEEYFWEGQLKMVVTCTPAWHPEQHVHIKC
jgi:mannose-6-phosphate isomerase-like protein (cupin superfamily)